MQRQRCKVCWSADGFDFNVPDEVWAAVVPRELLDRVVCLRCFDDFAAARGVDYSAYIDLLYFAGDAAALTFRRVRDG